MGSYLYELVLINWDGGCRVATGDGTVNDIRGDETGDGTSECDGEMRSEPGIQSGEGCVCIGGSVHVVSVGCLNADTLSNLSGSGVEPEP
ncbi:hypothetical protein Tco_0380040 [Tanacetum coccineum]